MDTKVYEDVFPGGEVVELSSYQLGGSIITSFYAEVNEYIMIREILYHRSDNKAISKDDRFIH